jgi:IS5 family transposase
MRHQLPLAQPFIEHEHARELEAISAILDELREVLRLVERDLTTGRSAAHGRPGLSAEQVLRALVVKQLNGFSYEELAFHLADSTSYRAFCRLGAFEESPSRSTLQENIKRLRADTLAAINRALVEHANQAGLEDGGMVRGDCTTVASHIHRPADSTLLWDTVRVLVRLLKRARAYGAEFTNHRRRAKRRWYGIQNAKRFVERVPLYRDLLWVCQETLADAEKAALKLRKQKAEEAQELSRWLLHYVALGQHVVAQTQRRVIDRERVPAPEKLVSIFEPHTDIIMKGDPDPEYGHKVFLTTGRSSLVLDCVILEGNPADRTLAVEMMERHRRIYHELPRQLAYDGGFASKANLAQLKAMGIPEVAFHKRCGLAISDMVRSSWVYKRLRNFRAGIEGWISFLKRCFGLARCLWHGFASFKAYVWSSILTANLLTFARHRLAT